MQHTTSPSQSTSHLTLRILIDPNVNDTFDIREELLNQGIVVEEDTEIRVDMDFVSKLSHYLTAAQDEHRKDILNVAREPYTGSGTLPLMLRLEFSKPVLIPAM